MELEKFLTNASWLLSLSSGLGAYRHLGVSFAQQFIFFILCKHFTLKNLLLEVEWEALENEFCAKL